MSAALVGGRLGKYDVRAEIGRGGMGVVYLGYDPLLERRVAIKVLAPHLVWQPGFVDRFLREARAAARLKHPNIVTIYDVGQEGGLYYFVMEFVEGQTLARLLGQGGALAPTQVVGSLRPLAGALDEAHRHGLVHRDVKPGNIMVGPEGQVTLTDFGIARAAQEVGLTATGTLVGTPEYMSPEQARGDAVDARTDQYSLAVVAYEMLSGEVPFGGTTPHGVLYRQIHEPLPPIREGRPDLPPPVQSVLERALAKDPARRYPTVGAFVQALGRALASEAAEEAPEAAADAPTLLTGKDAVARPVEARRPGHQRSAARDEAPSRPAREAPCAVVAPRGRRSWRRWLLAGLALVVVALLVGAALWIVGDGGEGPDRATSTALAAAPTGAVEATTAPRTPRSEPEQPPEAPAAERPFECLDPGGCVDILPGEPIQIGSLLATQAEPHIGGLDSRRGIELALADWHEVLGHPLELVGEETDCTPEAAVVGAERLADEPGLVAVVGPSCSEEAWAAVHFLCDQNLTAVSPSARASGLTADHRPPELSCFLRTAPNDAAVGAGAAEFARDALGVARAATVQDDSPYAETMRVSFAEAFAGPGGGSVLQEWVPPEGEGYEPLLIHIAESGARLIYFHAPLEATAQIMVRARQMPELAALQFLGTDQLFAPELLAMAGEAALGFHWVRADDEFGPAGWALEEQYVLRFGEPPHTPYYAHAYDAVTMILSAVQAAAVQDEDGTLHIGRSVLQELLRNTHDLEGVTGPLACSPTGDCVETRVAAYEAIDTDPHGWHPGPEPGNNPHRIWP